MQSSANNIKVIITGTTGMVGEGVLHECLQHPQVSDVLVINRKPLGITHPKLKEIIHEDFFDLSSIASRTKGIRCLFVLPGRFFGRNERRSVLPADLHIDDARSYYTQ